MNIISELVIIQVLRPKALSYHTTYYYDSIEFSTGMEKRTLLASLFAEVKKM